MLYECEERKNTEGWEAEEEEVGSEKKKCAESFEVSASNYVSELRINRSQASQLRLARSYKRIHGGPLVFYPFPPKERAKRKREIIIIIKKRESESCPHQQWDCVRNKNLSPRRICFPSKQEPFCIP